MTSDRYEELRAAAEAATPGPWTWDEGVTPFYNDANGYSCGGNGTGYAEGIWQCDPKTGETLFDCDGEPINVHLYSLENAKFITEAREHVPALLSERESLLAALKPFADAAENLDDWTPDHATVWESAAAMTISAGELRRAAALTTKEG